MSEVLRRRYQRLLFAYPPAYRDRRGEEIVGTLLDLADTGQRWPAPREVAALLVGGLHAWVQVNRHRPPRSVWLGGLRLAVLFLLAQATAQAGANAGLDLSWVTADVPTSPVEVIGFVLATVLAAAALVTVAGGRYLGGLLLIIAALVTEQTGAGHEDTSWLFRPGLVYFWPLPLAAALTLLLTRWRPPAARPWLWLLAVPAALLLLPTQFDATLHTQPWIFGAFLLACLLWAGIDARAAIGAAGLALAFTAWLLDAVLLDAEPSYWWPWLATGLTVTAVLLSAGFLRRTPQPDTLNP